MEWNNGNFVEMPAPQHEILNECGMQGDFCGKVGRKGLSKHSTCPYSVQEVQRDENRCIDSMLPNELSEEDMRILLLLCEENNTSEPCPNDIMRNQDSSNGNQSGGLFSNSINERTDKSIWAEESICEDRYLVDTYSRDYPEATQSISSANQNTNNSLSESQVDSSSSPTSNKKTVDPKKEINRLNQGRSGNISWRADILKTTLPVSRWNARKEMENYCRLLDEISRDYTDQLSDLSNAKLVSAETLHERSRSWMLKAIKDISKYTLFILPDFLGFKIWFEENYTLEKVCADSNDELKAMKFFCKTMYMMSVFECLYVYIQALAKAIGRKLLKKESLSPKGLDSLLSTLGLYKNERKRVGLLIVSIIRSIIGIGMVENTYRRGISARLSEMGINHEKILLFDIMIRILFIMDGGDFSYFNRRKSYIGDDTPLIYLVEVRSSEDEGTKRLKGYIEKYSRLLDEQLEIQGKNPLKDLTTDEGNVLEKLECLRETLLEVNWTIMTSNIVIERFPGFHSVIEEETNSSLRGERDNAR
jgi:hypothetical protein